ncbi:hypothetical protein [Roseovarius mucosus]|uniref:hypothetical protein n=1 Tax=Roseovarius mucosus TaxID=215743 RepID=UPI0035CFE10B
MSAWYRAGTISVPNGSTTLTGSGTAFVANVSSGMMVVANNQIIGEVAAVVSNTQITLAVAYAGTTLTGASYAIANLGAVRNSLITAVQDLTGLIEAAQDGALSGRFGDGTLAEPGMAFAGDIDTGFYRPAADQIGMVTGGVQRALLSSTALTLFVPIAGTVDVGRLRIGTNAAGTQTDLQMAANSVIAAESSITVGLEAAGYLRFMHSITDVAGGTAGGTEVWRIADGAMTLNGVPVWAEEITVADDAVGVIDLPVGRIGVMAVVNASLASGGDIQNASSGVVMLDAGATPAGISVYSGASFSVASTTLTGTTGTDGRTTVAPNTSGQLQIENRGGASRKYKVVFL